MAFFSHAAGKIYYEESGRGSPFLLLRGLGRSSRYWLGFEKILAERFHVIVMDQRGLGRTQIPAGWNGSLEENASDVLALMDHKGIDRFHIFGLSLGGMIGLEVAFRAPHRVMGLVVANSSSRESGFWRVNPMVLPPLIRAALSGQFHGKLLEKLTGPGLSLVRKDEIMKLWHEIRGAEGFPTQTILKQIIMAQRFAIGGRQLGAEVPLLLLAGAADCFVPPGHSRRLHALLAGSRYREVAGAGHEITIENEKELCALLWNFSQSIMAAHKTPV